MEGLGGSMMPQLEVEPFTGEVIAPLQLVPLRLRPPDSVSLISGDCIFVVIMSQPKCHVVPFSDSEQRRDLGKVMAPPACHVFPAHTLGAAAAAATGTAAACIFSTGTAPFSTGTAAGA